MKAVHLLVISLLICGLLGCRPAVLKLEPQQADQIKQVDIIAMQSPPLIVDALLAQSSLFGDALRTSTSVAMIPGQATQNIGSIGVLVFSALMLAKLPESMRQSKQIEASANALLGRQNVWKPSIVIADLLASELSTKHAYATHVHPTEHLYPNIGQLSSLSDWDRSQALGQWYAKPLVRVDPRINLSQDADCIIMVGLNGFGLNYPGYLRVGIHLIVIDPKTSEVLGKAWIVEQGYPQRTDAWLDNDAAKLKNELINIGKPMITHGLMACGLIESQASLASFPSRVGKVP